MVFLVCFYKIRGDELTNPKYPRNIGRFFRDFPLRGTSNDTSPVPPTWNQQGGHFKKLLGSFLPKPRGNLMAFDWPTLPRWLAGVPYGQGETENPLLLCFFMAGNQKKNGNFSAGYHGWVGWLAIKRHPPQDSPQKSSTTNDRPKTRTRVIWSSCDVSPCKVVWNLLLENTPWQVRSFFLGGFMGVGACWCFFPMKAWTVCRWVKGFPGSASYCRKSYSSMETKTKEPSKTAAGDFKYSLFSSRNLGKMNPIWRAYFSDFVGEKPPTRTGNSQKGKATQVMTKGCDL